MKIIYFGSIVAIFVFAVIVFTIDDFAIIVFALIVLNINVFAIIVGVNSLLKRQVCNNTVYYTLQYSHSMLEHLHYYTNSC